LYYIGYHRVIDNPESDKRVYPPNNIIKNTAPAVNRSHPPTIFSLPGFTKGYGRIFTYYLITGSGGI
jgi:hypothetical protein